MESAPKNEQKKFLKLRSSLESIDGTYKELPITLMEDGMPRATAFFDIDKTLAELKDIHGQTIKTLFKEFLDKEFEGIEDVYFQGFRLGNSFREFDRMNGIYNLGYTEWIDPEVYRKERLAHKMKDIDNEGTEEHIIAKMYLDRYAELASITAEDFFKNNPEKFEETKIKPIFVLAKLYKTLGIPMFGMTANGQKFVGTIAKYLNLSDLFIDIATDEDMIGGGKEVIIPKLVKQLEDNGVTVSKEKLIIVGDSLRGDIGSGFKYKAGGEEIQIKGILVVENKQELHTIQEQISQDKDLQQITNHTDTEAFVVDSVPIDIDGEPLLFSKGRRDFLFKL